MSEQTAKSGAKPMQYQTYTPRTEYSQQKKQAFDSIREMQRLQQQVKFLQQQQIMNQQRQKQDAIYQQRASFSYAQKELKYQLQEHLSQIKAQQRLELSQLASSVSSQEKQWGTNASQFRQQQAQYELEERKKVDSIVREQREYEKMKNWYKTESIHRQTREFDRAQKDRAEARRMSKNIQIMRQKQEEIEWLSSERQKAEEEIQRLMLQGQQLGMFAPSSQQK